MNLDQKIELTEQNIEVLESAGAEALAEAARETLRQLEGEQKPEAGGDGVGTNVDKEAEAGGDDVGTNVDKEAEALMDTINVDNRDEAIEFLKEGYAQYQSAGWESNAQRFAEHLEKLGVDVEEELIEQ